MNRTATEQIPRMATFALMAGLTGCMMRYIRIHSGMPLDGLSGNVFDWTFPLSIFIFHILSRHTACPGRHRKSRVFDEWSALWIIPFLLLGLSWKYWTSWQMVAAGMHWLYIVFRLVGIGICRQVPGKPRPLDGWDIAVFAAAAALLKLYTVTGPGTMDVLDLITASALAAGFAWFASDAAAGFAGEGFAGSLWQRGTGMVLLLSQPVLSLQNPLKWSALPVVGLLVYLSYYRREGKICQWAASGGAALVIAVAPIIYPGLIFLSVWMTVAAIANSKNSRSGNTGMLVSGGYIVLCLASALVSYIRIRGQFPPGDFVYPFPGIAAWLGGFIDRGRGILPVSPWILPALAGWLLATISCKGKDWIMWVGFPIVYSGCTISAWIATGQPPGWHHWLWIAPLIVPYIGKLWPIRRSGLAPALGRLFGFLTLLSGGCIWTVLSTRQGAAGSLDEWILIFSRHSGFNLTRLFPAISSIFPVVTSSITLWLVLMALGISILLATRITDRKLRWIPGIPDLLVFTVFMAGAGWALNYSGLWFHLPLKSDIVLGPGQSRNVPLPRSFDVSAVNMESRLSMSAHIPQGKAVASLILTTSGGQNVVKELRAGVDTAEWAYDRPDVMRIIQHDRPAIGRSWTVEELNGATYTGHAYRTSLYLGAPIPVTGLSVSNILTGDNGPVITISGIELMVNCTAATVSQPLTLDLNATVLTMDDAVLTRQLPGNHTVSGLILYSALSHGAEVEYGEVIGQITARCRDGRELLWLVRAGIETAEWSMDRPDMIGHVRHPAAPFAVSEKRMHGDVPYLAHTYSGRWFWNKALPVFELAIEFIPSQQEPELQWVLDRVTLY